MNDIRPIEIVNLIYQNQNQKFKYSWYYYYKIICKNKNEFTKIGTLVAITTLTIIANKVTKNLIDYIYKNK